MASVTPYYNGGAGYIGYVGGAKTARFRFTTGADGATALEFRTKNFWLEEPQDSSGYATQGHFRCAISTSATAYNGYAGSAGKAISDYYAGDPGYMHARITQNLLPNTTYYLFIFPDSRNLYCNWYIEGLTGNAVTLSGRYAQATTVTAQDGQFGEPVEITLNRQTSSYTHTLTATVDGSISVTIATKTTDYPTVTWAPAAADYLSQITNKKDVSVTITAETFNGDTSVGTDSTTIQLSFKESDAAPTAATGWVSNAPYNQSRGSTIAEYIQDISRARFTFDKMKISFVGGATLAELKVSAGTTAYSADVSAATPTTDSGILTGETVFTATATDSRGFSVTETVTVTPYPYTDPAVASYTVFRCDGSGTAAEGGNYLSITATASVSDINGLNTPTLRYWFRTLGSDYSGSGLPLTPGTARIDGGYNPDTSFEIKIQVTDTVGGTGTVLTRVNTRKWAMKFNYNATAVGFGKAPEHTEALELPDTWSIYFGATRWLDKVYPVGSIYLSVSGTDPGNLFGGIWARITDCFLLAASDPNGTTVTYTAGDTGGEATHTLTKAELPAEGVGLTTNYNGTDYPVKLYASNAAGGSQWPIATYGPNGVAAINTENLGSGQAHENMPPYLAVYVWKRTA